MRRIARDCMCDFLYSILGRCTIPASAIVCPDEGQKTNLCPSISRRSFGRLLLALWQLLSLLRLLLQCHLTWHCYRVRLLLQFHQVCAAALAKKATEHDLAVRWHTLDGTSIPMDVIISISKQYYVFSYLLPLPTCAPLQSLYTLLAIFNQRLTPFVLPRSLPRSSRQHPSHRIHCCNSHLAV